MSKDPNMYKAYLDGKDLYCVIAQNIFHNKYEDNQEFWPEGHKLLLDGKEIVCGTGREYSFSIDEINNPQIELPTCYKVNTIKGVKEVGKLVVGDIIKSEEGKELIIKSLTPTTKSNMDYFIINF